MRQRLLCGLLLGLASATGTAAAPAARDRPPLATTTVEERQAIEKAVAGAVVGALSEQFNGRRVEVRFNGIDATASDNGHRVVTGAGGLRFTGEQAWIGFRFRTVYDTMFGQAAYPEVVMGAGADERPIPNDTHAVRQLDERTSDTLRRELGLPGVRLQLDRIETVETGQHYLSIDAWGLADFGRDGSSNIQIRALYDRSNGQWLQLNYDLGPPPEGEQPLAGR